MKRKHLVFIAVFATIAVACSREEAVPEQVVKYAIDNFESTVFFGDIDSTFNSYREYNVDMRVDSVRSIEVNARLFNDYYLLQFIVSGTLYDGFDPLPYDVYQGKYALYTIFNNRKSPSAKIKSILRDKHILRPYNPNPRRYIEENINVYHYYFCKEDIHKFRLHVADTAMRDTYQPKSVCE